MLKSDEMVEMALILIMVVGAFSIFIIPFVSKSPEEKKMQLYKECVEIKNISTQQCKDIVYGSDNR